jgi:hypothetical protein
MQLPNTTKIVKSKGELQVVLDEGIKHIQTELESFGKLIEPKVIELGTYLANLVKEVMELNTTYETLKAQVVDLEKQKQGFVELKEKLDKQAADQDNEAKELLALHKVLENKRLMLEGKENPIKF